MDDDHNKSVLGGLDIKNLFVVGTILAGAFSGVWNLLGNVHGDATISSASVYQLREALADNARQTTANARLLAVLEERVSRHAETCRDHASQIRELEEQIKRRRQ